MATSTSEIDPDGTALVVMDCQPGIISRLSDATRTCVDAARGAPGRRRGSADAPQTQYDACLAPVAGDIAVRKSRVGALSSTDLGAQLRGRGIDTLVLAGIATSGAVLSTVRDAGDHDYRQIVIRDACADPDPDPDPETHDFLCERIFPRQASVVTASKLARALSS